MSHMTKELRLDSCQGQEIFLLSSASRLVEANPVFYSMGKVVPAHAIKITEEWLYSTTPRVPI
jgi:hypothetical protein